MVCGQGQAGGTHGVTPPFYRAGTPRHPLQGALEFHRPGSVNSCLMKMSRPADGYRWADDGAQGTAMKREKRVRTREKNPITGIPEDAQSQTPGKGGPVCSYPPILGHQTQHTHPTYTHTHTTHTTYTHTTHTPHTPHTHTTHTPCFCS